MRTPLGLAVRMVGENPSAAEGQGLNVAHVRTGAIVAGSGLMGVAGAFLTLAAFNAFYFNMVNGRGWVCVAMNYRLAPKHPWPAQIVDVPAGIDDDDPGALGPDFET